MRAALGSVAFIVDEVWLAGDVQPMVGLAVQVQALGAEERVCATPDQECARLLAGVDVPLVPISQPVRPPVTKATGFAHVLNCQRRVNV